MELLFMLDPTPSQGATSYIIEVGVLGDYLDHAVFLVGDSPWLLALGSLLGVLLTRGGVASGGHARLGGQGTA